MFILLKMSENEQQQTVDEITAFTTAYLNHINAINDYLPRIKNVEYNANTNTTSIYGHTNFEELKVNNSPVALQSHNHDSTYAGINHNHDGIYSRTWHTHTAADVYVDEEETLDEALDGKADVGHNHDSSYAAINHNHDSSYAEIEHTHSISDVSNLQTALDGKASTNHTHTADNVLVNWSYTYQMNNDPPQVVSGTEPLSDLIDYTPLGNTLKFNTAIKNDYNITAPNLKSNNETRLAAVESGLSGKASTSHTHTLSDITDLSYASIQALPDYTAPDLSNYAASSHTHSISDVSNLQTALDGKASTNHNHDSSYASINHTHSGYASSSHTHTLSDITDYQASSYDDSNYAKLNQSNTFTANQIISNGNSSSTTYHLQLYNPNIGSGYSSGLKIGKSDTEGNAVNIRFVWYGDNDINNYLGFHHVSYYYTYPLKLYRDRVKIETPLSVNGTTTIHTIQADSLFVFNTTANSNAYIWVGNSDSGYENRGTFGWIGNSTASERCVAAWCRGADIQRWYQDRTTITKPLTVNDTITMSGQTLTMSNANPLITMTGGTTGELRIKCGTNDYARFYGGQTASNAGYLEIATGDDANEPIYARQYSGVFSTLKRTATLLDGSGNTSFPGSLDASSLGSSLKAAIRDFVYPVGALYISYSSTSPATLFGGSWTQITNRFLYCANSSGTTGGEEKHTLTAAEMPVHNHSQGVYVQWQEGGFWVGNGSWTTLGFSSNNPTTGNAGGSNGATQAHNNMPPYITVYCWRRTA